MAWLKLTLHIAQGDAERVSEVLEAHGAIAVTLEDAADEVLIETHWDEAPMWREITASALLPAQTDVTILLAAIGAAGIAARGAPVSAMLKDQEWATVWMDRYHPIEVGRKLWICPSWCTPPDPGAVNVVLDPGLAFGTGTHATTALCLDWLATQALHGADVIDYGCGSGILAVAALKLGAARAYATDLDPVALAVARDNAERNAVADRLIACEPDALPRSEAADVVVANILAAALVELAPHLTDLTRTGGQLLLSGIMRHQADEVAAAYARAFDLTRRTREDWVLLVGRKR
jgi:ribosomal protein L11 methyltransferase